MPLRLLEVIVPGERGEAVGQLLDGSPAIHVWTVTDVPDHTSVKVLLHARDAETASDLLTDRFGGREGFRVVLLPVEGTTPPVDESDDSAAEEGADSGGRSQRISREELYEDIASATELTWPFIVLVGISTLVAAVGLIRGDVAVVIGAMVIAPLLGPNMALALAATLGDVGLAKRSLRTIVAGISTAGAISLALGAAFDVAPSLPEIARRTGADLGDVVLALSAGAAGSLAFTSGVPAVVVGVMVAVALLPPLVVAGLLAGAGFQGPAFGAVVLPPPNVTCVNLAAVGTFLVQSVEPRTWWEADRARRATRIAVAAWVVMLAVLAALIVLGHVDVQEV